MRTETEKRWPLRAGPLLFFAAMVFAGGVFTWLVWDSLSDGQLAKRRALCDQSVSALLTSTDLIEVQRAGFLVRQFDCSITRRL
jgi:hypothetical protein